MIKRLVVSEGREELAVEGNDLLLNSERGGGGGGVVVSKEEVPVGRKGSGGAWGRPAPQNGRIRTLAEKKAKKVDRWDVGCNLVVLKMTCSQSGCRVHRHFLASPVRAIQGA